MAEQVGDIGRPLGCGAGACAGGGSVEEAAGVAGFLRHEVQCREDTPRRKTSPDERRRSLWVVLPSGVRSPNLVIMYSA